MLGRKSSLKDIFDGVQGEWLRVGTICRRSLGSSLPGLEVSIVR